MEFEVYHPFLVIMFDCILYLSMTCNQRSMPKRHFAQAKVTQRKQIAVPKKVRERLGDIEEGDFILFFEDGDRIYIEKGRIRPV